jgi:hydroxyacylglutathione hydrolase
MIMQVLTLGPFQSNCYILGCAKTRAALVIDPGDEPDRIAADLARLELRPVVWLHTHGHIDHVSAAGALKPRFGGEILLHRADLPLYEAIRDQGEAFGVPIPMMAPVDRFVDEGDEVVWGQARGKVLHTPGHSPGGICLLVAGELMDLGGSTRIAAAGSAKARPDWVFTGDLLFHGSVGRTDLPGGSYEVLMESIREKILPLPDETVVASGHGPLTTVGQEKRINPFVLELL